MHWLPQMLKPVGDHLVHETQEGVHAQNRSKVTAAVKEVLTEAKCCLQRSFRA